MYIALPPAISDFSLTKDKGISLGGKSVEKRAFEFEERFEVDGNMLFIYIEKGTK
jgi:hypothetical protein